MDKTNSLKIEDAYSLSPIQRGILFQTLSSREAQLYLEQMAVKITGNLNIPAFEEAWRLLVKNNPIFRTLFDYGDDKEPLQFVVNKVNLSFIHEDLTGLSQADSENYWLNYQTRDRVKGFELEFKVPYRLALFKMPDSSFRFLFSYHHILLDGGSIPIIMQELAHYYSEIITGNNPKIKPRRTYKEYLDWLSNQDYQKAKDFWSGYINGWTVNLYKKGIKLDSASSSFDSLTFSDEIYNGLKTISRSYGLTLASILSAIWAATYCSHNKQEETTVGIPTSMRPSDESGGDFIGLCINTLPLRIKPSDVSYLEAMKNIQEDWFKTSQYSFLPLAEIKKLFKDYSINDPFDSIFTFSSHRASSEPVFQGIKWELQDHLESTQYPLSVDLVCFDNSMLLKITYRPEFYTSNDIKSLLDIFKNKAIDFIANPNSRIIESFDNHKSSFSEIHDHKNTSAKPEYDQSILNQIVEDWRAFWPEHNIDAKSNFFELGGDSITSLRIVSKLLTHGLSINPQDIFEYQTPEMLACKIFRDKKLINKSDIPATKSELSIPKQAVDYASDLYKGHLEKILPVSNIQKGILDSGQKADLYHDQSTFTYVGDLYPKIFESAWDNVISRNASLRTLFCEIEGTWYQCIIKNLPVKLEYCDISQEPEKNEVIQEAINSDRHNSFTIGTGPLIRISLFKTDDKEFIFFLRFHVLVMDGWCFAFVLKEVMDEYDAQVRHTHPHIIKRPTYDEYIGWLQGKDISEAKKYWAKYLYGINPALIINHEKPKNNLASSTVKTIQQDLSDSLIRRLSHLATKYRVTLNTVFQTAWAINLSRRSKIDDIVLGITVSQRPADLKNSEDIIGLFFNDIPLRVKVKNSASFWETARSVQRDFQESNKYQFLSAYEIKKELGLKQDEYIFQTLLVYENYPKHQEESLKSKQQDHFVNTSYWRREMSDIDLTVYIGTQLGAGHIKVCYLENIISHGSAFSTLNDLMVELNNIEQNDC